MPTLGDIYRKSADSYVEITAVTSKSITCMVHPSRRESTISVAEFVELERRTLENGAVLERGCEGMNDSAFQ